MGVCVRVCTEPVDLRQLSYVHFEHSVTAVNNCSFSPEGLQSHSIHHCSLPIENSLSHPMNTTIVNTGPYLIIGYDIISTSFMCTSSCSF